MFRDDRNYGGSDILECTTRALIRDGHNLSLDGAPASQGGCGPCKDEHCCNYISPECGCKASNCVDNLNKDSKPTVEVLGKNGNVFNILAICRMALRLAGQKEQAIEMVNRVQRSSNYNEALTIMQEYVVFK